MREINGFSNKANRVLRTEKHVLVIYSHCKNQCDTHFFLCIFLFYIKLQTANKRNPKSGILNMIGYLQLFTFNWGG